MLGLSGFEVVVSVFGVFISGVALGFKVGAFFGERRPLMQSRKPFLCSVPVEVGASDRSPFVSQQVSGVNGDLVAMDCPFYRHRLGWFRRHWCAAAHGRCQFFTENHLRLNASRDIKNPVTRPTRKLRIRTRM